MPDAKAPNVAEQSQAAEGKGKLRTRDRSSSYAQVVAAKGNSSENVRNIFIDIENEEAAAQMMQQITTDKDLPGCGPFISITKKSNRLLTVKATKPETMVCCDRFKQRKFGNKVKSKPPDKRQFLVKLTGTDPDAATKEELIMRLKAKNDILKEKEIAVQRSYDIVGAKRTYRNHILSLDPVTHSAVIDKGTIIYGFCSHNVYEYVDSIQCKCCWRHGYFIHGCTFPEACRKCGGDHPLEACTIQQYSYEDSFVLPVLSTEGVH